MPVVPTAIKMPNANVALIFFIIVSFILYVVCLRFGFLNLSISLSQHSSVKAFAVSVYVCICVTAEPKLQKTSVMQ